MPKKLTVALAGNPNSGKTTIFNNLTGARQHVGNYAGVTVEKKEGTCKLGDQEITVVDLPGTYSLTAYSIEEVVARDFIINEKPDVVVDIIDASNLERNLYLAVQLIELGVPLVLAYNMSDAAKQRGFKFDLKQMSEYLGAPIVPTVGHKNRGTQELLEAVQKVANGEWVGEANPISYGREIDKAIERVEKEINEDESLAEKFDSKWLAIKLLENDKEVKKSVSSESTISVVDEISKRLEGTLGDSPEIIIADRRYGFISGVCTETVESTVEARHNFSDRIDAIVTNRLLGLPIFVLLMYLTFQLTFTLGDYPMQWLEALSGWLAETISAWWPKGSDSLLRSLIIDGVIGGVGGVVVFLPNIVLLFLAIALLEGSGYMARAAFIMDRLMHKIGLHGKSFIPMLTGFGCSVPAILATRTLENEKDRLTTMLVTPLMSCGARLPIYALIIPAFFPPAWRAPVLWLIYFIGIALAVALAKLLRMSMFKGETTPFVMELPPYRMPTLKSLFLHTWERSWLYLKKAGTIILGVSIVLWAMTTFPRKTEYERDYDTENAAAEKTFLAGTRALNGKLGLKPESDALVAAVQVELELVAEQDKYHEKQPGFAAAEETAEQKLKTVTERPDGDLVAEFLRVRDGILTANAEFGEAVSELDEDSPAYAVRETKRDSALARLERSNHWAYAAATEFIAKVDAPYQERVSGLANRQQAEELEHSFAGRVGRLLAPVVKPLGFDWRIATALIGAFAAKEVFVAQMGIVFSMGETTEGSAALRATLLAEYTPLIGFCIMLFCLIASPCMATVAVTKRESNSWKYAILQWVGLTAIAYVLCLVVYQVGSLLGF